MIDKITEIVKVKIENITYGYVFTASDFPIDVIKQKSVNKVLENLTKAGKIRRLSKGRYYKTKATEFGELLPVCTIWQTIKNVQNTYSPPNFRKIYPNC